MSPERKILFKKVEKVFGLPIRIKEIREKHWERRRGVEGRYPFSTLVIDPEKPGTITVKHFAQNPETKCLKFVESIVFKGKEIEENKYWISPLSGNLLDRLLGHTVEFIGPAGSTEKPQR
jgi:hypothetical protein